MRLGIFGGSFNPIHIGHTHLAEAFIRQAGLDMLWFVVSPMNPLKKDENLLADDLRLEMTKLALNDIFPDSAVIKASDYEFHLPRPSYMINTLDGICHDYPHYEPVLLIGEDNWTRFPQWYRADEIIERFPIYVYPRQEKSRQKMSLNVPENGNVHLLQAPLYDISSTQIREMVKKHQDISHLVTPSVAAFIHAHRLYLA